MYKKKKKRKEQKREKRGVERSYQVRYWVYLSYYLLKMVPQEVEGASVTPSHLDI